MYVLADQRLRRTEAERNILMHQADAEIDKSMCKVREILKEYHTEAQNAPKPWNERAEKLQQQIAEIAAATAVRQATAASNAATTLAQRQTQFVETVQTGDTVYVMSFNRTGTVLKIRRKKQTLVLLIEDKQVEVPATDIYPAENTSSG